MHRALRSFSTSLTPRRTFRCTPNGQISPNISASIEPVGQPFVKDPDISVGKLLADAGAEVSSFVRFEVGEGIEKKQENFADEVMKQIEDSKKKD